MNRRIRAAILAALLPAILVAGCGSQIEPTETSTVPTPVREFTPPIVEVVATTSVITLDHSGIVDEIVARLITSTPTSLEYRAASSPLPMPPGFPPAKIITDEQITLVLDVLVAENAWLLDQLTFVFGSLPPEVQAELSAEYARRGGFDR